MIYIYNIVHRQSPAVLVTSFVAFPPYQIGKRSTAFTLSVVFFCLEQFSLLLSTFLDLTSAFEGFRPVVLVSDGPTFDKYLRVLDPILDWQG